MYGVFCMLSVSINGVCFYSIYYSELSYANEHQKPKITYKWKTAMLKLYRAIGLAYLYHMIQVIAGEMRSSYIYDVVGFEQGVHFRY